MSIKLPKGRRVDVGLQKIGIGLGWNPNTQSSSEAFDLDASAFMLSDNGKLLDSDFFVFYNNPQCPDGAVLCNGDNRDGDDESFYVDLNSVDPKVDEIVFVVEIHNAEDRRQNFGQVRDLSIRIYDQSNNKELCRYELVENFSTEFAVGFGSLYRCNRSWKFEAIGRGYQEGFYELLKKYL
jgi:tellurium resistance protein TerD